MFYYINHQPHKTYALIGKLIDLIETHQLKEDEPDRQVQYTYETQDN